ALGGADLGREVRQRHQVVAEHRRLLREPVTGQLHPVTGVTREPDDHPIKLLDLLALLLRHDSVPTSSIASSVVLPTIDGLRCASRASLLMGEGRAVSRDTPGDGARGATRPVNAVISSTFVSNASLEAGRKCRDEDLDQG